MNVNTGGLYEHANEAIDIANELLTSNDIDEQLNNNTEIQNFLKRKPQLGCKSVYFPTSKDFRTIIRILDICDGDPDRETCYHKIKGLQQKIKVTDKWIKAFVKRACPHYINPKTKQLALSPGGRRL